MELILNIMKLYSAKEFLKSMENCTHLLNIDDNNFYALFCLGITNLLLKQNANKSYNYLINH